MLVAIENLQLVMWERKELPDRRKDPETGEWVKTGEMIEKTLYILRDEFGETLKFLSNNEYRDLEGSLIRLTIDIVYNDYQNKVTVSLKEMTQLA